MLSRSAVGEYRAAPFEAAADHLGGSPISGFGWLVYPSIGIDTFVRVDGPLFMPETENCPRSLLPWQGWQCTGGRSIVDGHGALPFWEMEPLP